MFATVGDMKTTSDIIRKARELGLGLPAFNIAHLPMTEPVVRAVRDQDSFALLEVSRIDWQTTGDPAVFAAEVQARIDSVQVAPVTRETQAEIDEFVRLTRERGRAPPPIERR